MLTSDELRAILLDKGESDILDFKAEPYELSSLEAKGKFIKDIISMYNTPRDQSAYIIIGVKHNSIDNSRELLGVVEHLDDSDLHAQLNDTIVEPLPDFQYQPIQVDSKSYGVFEIKVQKNGGPCYVKKQYGNFLIPNKLYFRHGSMNTEATGVDRDSIQRWFYDSPKSPAPEKEIPQDPPSILRWDEFYAASHYFELNRHYILVLGPQRAPELNWQHLGRLPISLVLDFDPDTEGNGVYGQAGSEMKRHRAVHLWTQGNVTLMNPDRACYWFAARGIEGRNTTIVQGDWRAWNQKYSRELQQLIEEYVRSANGKPITVISMWEAQQYIRTVFQGIDAVAGPITDYVIAVDSLQDLSSFEQDFEATVIHISAADILLGIENHLPLLNGESRPPASIPTYSGSAHVLNQESLRWFSEDMEVVHSSVERWVDEDPEAGIKFLKGGEVSWQALDSHFDADRRKTNDLLRVVREQLGTRKTVRVNLNHWPGSGGSTVARRVGWECRNEYPVVILRHISDGTISRLSEISRLTNQSILVIIEAADIVDDDRERIFNKARTENIACVFVNVVRKFEIPSTTDRSHLSLFLDQRLDNQESFRFAEAFRRVVPQNGPALDEILNGQEKDRTPFHFALAAFGRDFQGLSRYIESRLQPPAASPLQQQLMAFIAMAYYYGHKPIQPQIFTSLLAAPERRVLRLENYLGDPQKELLIHNEDGTWRPSHQLIAEQILKSILSGFQSQHFNWKRNLATWSRDFIDLCSRSSHTPHRDLIDLLRRIFILRDEAELLGTESAASSRFARIIEGIPTNEGRLSVFDKLTEEFPGEAHFWGHLGRFHSSLDNPELAIRAIKIALQITPQDATLHHMHGMALRAIVYRLMQSENLARNRVNNAQQETTWQDIKPYVEEALEAFAASRKYDPNSEHGFISPVQMLIRVVDFGYKASRLSSRAEFLVSRTPLSAWCRKLLDEAENLMDGIRQAREGDSPSGFFRDSAAKIAEAYGDYATALQGWNNLLTQPDVYAPPVRRQIVRAYLGRRDNNWGSLSGEHIEQVIELMEQNLREEPSSEASMRIWFRAIRHAKRDYTEIALDRLANWRATGDTVDAYFYLYVLHVLKAMDGQSIERTRSEELIQQCRTRARNQRNRTRSHEWFGQGHALNRLVNSLDLGEWNPDSGFYSNIKLLKPVEGRVERISAPESGIVEVADCGLKAFFVPAVAKLEKGRDENRRISFFLGFSYDGMRAWSVTTL